MGGEKVSANQKKINLINIKIIVPLVHNNKNKNE